MMLILINDAATLSNWQQQIFMTGSHTHVTRNIYEQNGKFYIVWYGEYIEVEHTKFGTWQTVEEY